MKSASTLFLASDLYDVAFEAETKNAKSDAKNLTQLMVNINPTTRPDDQKRKIKFIKSRKKNLY